MVSFTVWQLAPLEKKLCSLFGFLNIKMRKRHNSESDIRVVHMVEVGEAPVPLLSYKVDAYFYQESQLIVCPVGQKTWLDYGPCRTRLNMVPGQGDPYKMLMIVSIS